MKKIICMMLMLCILSASMISVNAKSTNVEIGGMTHTLETTDVYVNGEKLVTDQDAVIFEGRTLVPLRAICELLNCHVEWNEANQGINISNVASAISMAVGAYEFKKVYISDEQDIETVYIDVPPMIINGRTMVPARAISEVLGADVYWDEVNNKVDIILEYDGIWNFHEDMALVTRKTDDGYKYGFINKEREVLVPLIYEDVDNFSEGLACVMKDGKCGFVDKTGKEVVPCIYDRVWDFSEGLAKVEEDGYYGFIYKTGKEVIPCIYDYAYSFAEGLSAVEEDGYCGFVDKTGKKVIPCIYGYAGNFSEGLAKVEEDGYWGFIDKTGKAVIPCIYDYAYSFVEGMAIVEEDGYFGFIDKTGKKVIPCIYDRVWDFSEGLAKVEEDGYYGFIDKTGKEVVPCIYDYVGSFDEGLAVVEEDGYCGFIDKTGKEVIPVIYDDVVIFENGVYFKNGVCEAYLDGEKVLIDKNGDVIGIH